MFWLSETLKWDINTQIIIAIFKRFLSHLRPSVERHEPKHEDKEPNGDERDVVALDGRHLPVGGVQTQARPDHDTGWKASIYMSCIFNNTILSFSPISS